MSIVRIGILGAARIAPNGIVRPARTNDEAEVVVVAARDRSKAEAFASKHGIPRVADSYQAVIDDPGVDAIYNPLPNGLHAEWTRKAVAAGKHVLCEKPFTSNAAEARVVAAEAEQSGLVVMEAFHYRYHPMAKRAVEIISGGELGDLERVETALCFPLPRFSDIRYQLDLAGGATMDAGCYAVHMARTFGGGEPEVASARAKLHSEEVDRAMTGELLFPGGYPGKVTASMWSSSLLRLSARVWGSKGRITLINPLGPQMWHRLSVTAAGKTRRETFTHRHTYAFQLDAFCGAVLRGEPILTPPSDAVANMVVIDALYTAAGLHPRPSVA
ncbi:MAG: Gfo/Idh/MocA family oxidoreductase [Acidimicrobiales bacterium]